jgi:transcription elongation factor Elf1
METKLTCPDCGSDSVAVTEEQMFMANTGEHYCHSVKAHDNEARARCLSCHWTGHRGALVGVPEDA